MKNPPIKITRTLLTFKTMALKLHVNLKGDNEKFSFYYHNETEFANNKYLNINPSASISIDMIDKENNFIYDKSKSLRVNQLKLYQLIMFFRRVLKGIYKKELFVIQSGKIILQKDVAKKVSEIFQLSENTAIGWMPTVIYDENEISYEGVNLFINKTENIILLSIDELETLLYTLEKIDLYQYSQLLINYYVSYYKDDLHKNNHSNYNNYNRRKLIWDNKQTETVTANFSKEEEDIMSGLPK